MSEAGEKLVPTFIPALVVLLVRAEQRKGSPLTQEEVIHIRDGGACVMLPESQAAHLSEKRGYADVDPQFAWEQWQEVRGQLKEGSD
jgi:hypothetical protein